MANYGSMGGYSGVEVHRVSSDVNGNPRYVVHYRDMSPRVPRERLLRGSAEDVRVRLDAEFEIAKRALFGREYRGPWMWGEHKYRRAWVWGGIVFSTYEDLDSYIAEARQRVYLEFARAGFTD